MAVTYTRLWKRLVDRRMIKCYLCKTVGSVPNAITKLRSDDLVMFSVLNKICKTLDCNYRILFVLY